MLGLSETNERTRHGHTCTVYVYLAPPLSNGRVIGGATYTFACTSDKRESYMYNIPCLFLLLLTQVNFIYVFILYICCLLLWQKGEQELDSYSPNPICLFHSKGHLHDWLEGVLLNILYMHIVWNPSSREYKAFCRVCAGSTQLTQLICIRSHRQSWKLSTGYCGIWRNRASNLWQVLYSTHRHTQQMHRTQITYTMYHHQLPSSTLSMGGSRRGQNGQLMRTQWTVNNTCITSTR